jgi:hypothetical protein
VSRRHEYTYQNHSAKMSTATELRVRILLVFATPARHNVEFHAREQFCAGVDWVVRIVIILRGCCVFLGGTGGLVSESCKHTYRSNDVPVHTISSSLEL